MPIRKGGRSRRRPAASRFSPSGSRPSVTTTVPAIRRGSSRRNGSGRAKAERFKLHLLSNQPKLRLHSQLDNGPVSRAAKVQGREPLWINPDDAAARGISDGDVVRVFNDRGACLAGAVVTDAISPGVTLLQTGAWYDPDTPGRVGALDRHGNPNVLTLDKGTSKLAQGPSSQTALVEVEPWTEASACHRRLRPARDRAG